MRSRAPARGAGYSTKSPKEVVRNDGKDHAIFAAHTALQAQICQRAVSCGESLFRLISGAA
jgi:hypothetical protein